LRLDPDLGEEDEVEAEVGEGLGVIVHKVDKLVTS
jgi:hypothetical protein